jgi:hypothetical protein
MSTPYCRHIRTNGRRCCSFAVRGASLCYFHRSVNARMRSINPPPADDAIPTIIHPLNTADHRQRDPILAEYFAGTRPQAPLDLDFPTLEDRESIQVALSMLISALGHNRIDPKRAGPILYCLQVATSNAPKLNIEPGANKVVRSTVIDPSGHELAPDEDPQEITEFNQWLAELEADENEQDELDEESDEDDETDD